MSEKERENEEFKKRMEYGMKKYEYLDDYGTFRLENPTDTSYLYFPLAAEEGIKSSITPYLGGDIKLDQNHFLLQPVSAEELHNNKSTRNFWCILGDGSCVSLTGVSSEAMSRKFTEEQDECTLEAGVLWHRITRKNKKAALSSSILSFVPIADGQVELMLVTVTNDAEKSQVLSPIGAIPIYGRSADNLRDHRHVTSLLHGTDTVEYGVEVTPLLSFDERGHVQGDTTYNVYGATENGEPPAGFYSLVEDFIGEGGNFEHPRAVYENLPAVGVGDKKLGYESMGGLRFQDICLAPGESATFILMLGMEKIAAPGEEYGNRIMKIFNKYNSKEKVTNAFVASREYWKKKLNVSYHTREKNFDRFMYWVNFQPMLRRIYGCSFLPHHDYGRGGRGWRDLWQDCLALLIMNPEGVREMLLSNYGGVRIDGTNATIIGSRPGEFIADRNNITRVWMDHGLWPLITTKMYIDQTGDLGILLKNQTYFKDRQAARGTKLDADFKETMQPVQKDSFDREYAGTILEHILVQNLTCFYEVGSHNHMRLRGADWNDALDMAPLHGESVAFTAAYAGNFEQLAELLSMLRKEKQMEYVEVAKEMEPLFADDEALYDDMEAKLSLLSQYEDSCIHTLSGEKTYLPVENVIQGMHHKAEWLKQHIRNTEWIQDQEDGWFNSYYDEEEKQVEGFFEDGVHMMLTGQVFSIMSGTATDDQTRAIARSADKYLYREEAGGYRLNTRFKNEHLGRMFSFGYGHKENGAVFSHMTTMYANALYQRGFVKEGYKAIHTLFRQADHFEVSRIYPGIPEYFNERGRGMYHYLTGAASWMMLTVITEMFGVKGRYGALVLEPKLMAEQFDEEGRASIKLTFGRRKWNVIYINAGRKEAGEYTIGTLYLDGKKMDIPQDHVVADCTEIQKMDAASEHEIVVELI